MIARKKLIYSMLLTFFALTVPTACSKSEFQGKTRGKVKKYQQDKTEIIREDAPLVVWTMPPKPTPLPTFAPAPEPQNLDGLSLLGVPIISNGKKKLSPQSPHSPQDFHVTIKDLSSDASVPLDAKVDFRVVSIASGNVVYESRVSEEFSALSQTPPLEYKVNLPENLPEGVYRMTVSGITLAGDPISEHSGTLVIRKTPPKVALKVGLSSHSEACNTAISSLPTVVSRLISFGACITEPLQYFPDATPVHVGIGDYCLIEETKHNDGNPLSNLSDAELNNPQFCQWKSVRELPNTFMLQKSSSPKICETLSASNTAAAVTAWEPCETKLTLLVKDNLGNLNASTISQTAQGVVLRRVADTGSTAVVRLTNGQPPYIDITKPTAAELAADASSSNRTWVPGSTHTLKVEVRDKDTKPPYALIAAWHQVGNLANAGVFGCSFANSNTFQLCPSPALENSPIFTCPDSNETNLEQCSGFDSNGNGILRVDVKVRLPAEWDVVNNSYLIAVRGFDGHGTSARVSTSPIGGRDPFQVIAGRIDKGAGESGLRAFPIEGDDELINPLYADQNGNVLIQSLYAGDTYAVNSTTGRSCRWGRHHGSPTTPYDCPNVLGYYVNQNNSPTKVTMSPYLKLAGRDTLRGTLYFSTPAESLAEVPTAHRKFNILAAQLGSNEEAQQMVFADDGPELSPEVASTFVSTQTVRLAQAPGRIMYVDTPNRHLFFVYNRALYVIKIHDKPDGTFGWDVKHFVGKPRDNQEHIDAEGLLALAGTETSVRADQIELPNSVTSQSFFIYNDRLFIQPSVTRIRGDSLSGLTNTVSMILEGISINNRSSNNWVRVRRQSIYSTVNYLRPTFNTIPGADNQAHCVENGFNWEHYWPNCLTWFLTPQSLPNGKILFNVYRYWNERWVGVFDTINQVIHPYFDEEFNPVASLSESRYPQVFGNGGYTIYEDVPGGRKSLRALHVSFVRKGVLAVQFGIYHPDLNKSGRVFLLNMKGFRGNNFHQEANYLDPLWGHEQLGRDLDDLPGEQGSPFSTFISQPLAPVPLPNGEMLFTDTYNTYHVNSTGDVMTKLFSNRNATGGFSTPFRNFWGPITATSPSSIMGFYGWQMEVIPNQGSSGLRIVSLHPATATTSNGYDSTPRLGCVFLPTSSSNNVFERKLDVPSFKTSLNSSLWNDQTNPFFTMMMNQPLNNHNNSHPLTRPNSFINSLQAFRSLTQTTDRNAANTFMMVPENGLFVTNNQSGTLYERSAFTYTPGNCVSHHNEQVYGLIFERDVKYFPGMGQDGRVVHGYLYYPNLGIRQIKVKYNNGSLDAPNSSANLISRSLNDELNAKSVSLASTLPHIRDILGEIAGPNVGSKNCWPYTSTKIFPSGTAPYHNVSNTNYYNLRWTGTDCAQVTPTTTHTHSSGVTVQEYNLKDWLPSDGLLTSLNELKMEPGSPGKNRFFGCDRGQFVVIKINPTNSSLNRIFTIPRLVHQNNQNVLRPGLTATGAPHSTTATLNCSDGRFIYSWNAQGNKQLYFLTRNYQTNHWVSLFEIVNEETFETAPVVKHIPLWGTSFNAGYTGNNHVGLDFLRAVITPDGVVTTSSLTDLVVKFRRKGP